MKVLEGVVLNVLLGGKRLAFASGRLFVRCFMIRTFRGVSSLKLC